MNIRILLLIFLSISIFSCTTENQKRKTDVDKLNLNGKVRSYQEIIYRTSNYRIDSLESVLKETHHGDFLSFNDSGNIIEQRSFKKGGEPYGKWISIYDKNEYEIEKIEIKYPKYTLKRWVNKYDKSGNEIESLIYDHKDSLLSHTKSIFNDLNKETELIVLQNKKSKNQLIKVNYQYDNNGNKIKTTRFYEDKSKTEWFTEYDSLGNDIEWRVYDRQGKLERKDIYQYDINNNIIEEKMFNADNKLDSRGISKYNNQGNEIEYFEYFNDSTFKKEISIYDNSNDRIKISYYNTKGVLTEEWTSEFKYDDYDNLIQEKNWKDGKLAEIRNYSIDYWQ